MLIVYRAAEYYCEQPVTITCLVHT